MSGKDMKISVIMAVYNGGECLRRTIESVLAQTWKDFELVCIDDGSTDGISGKILDEYAAKDSRLVVRHRENRGLCATLDEFHELAKGDFIARTDQDDVFHPQLLEYCKRAVEEHDLDFFAFRYSNIDEKTAPVFKDLLAQGVNVTCWNRDKQKVDPEGYRKALVSIHTDSWAHFVRRDLMLRHPCTGEKELSKLFAQLQEPIRWGVTQDCLYFYDTSVSSSMMHQPFSIKIWNGEVADMRRLMAIYDETIKAGDPFGEWAAVCKAYVIAYLKTAYNKIRRSKGSIPEEERQRDFEAFTVAASSLLNTGCVPMRYVRFRHRVAYRWLMFKHRRAIRRALGG